MNPLTVCVCVCVCVCVIFISHCNCTVLFACIFRRDSVPSRDMVDTKCQHEKLITRYRAWVHLALSFSLHACLSSSVCTLTAVSFIRSYVTLVTSNETVECSNKVPIILSDLKENFILCLAINKIHSFSSLSYDRSEASSKASSPHSAIQSFLLQMRVSSPFLNP